MKAHARVAVIGGGVVGCSVLYHLTKLGWQDVVLLERADLTAGSTWHAAGGMHTLNGDPSVAALQDYTIKLYGELERESGLSCGIHRTGCIYLAVTDRELDFFKVERAKARHLGLALDFIGLTEARERLPLIETDVYRAAMFDPNDGHVDPSGVTYAYAEAARKKGARIYRHRPVQALTQAPNGEWEVVTAEGTICVEYVVNAAGLWAREVGRMMNVELPLVPMEHQYIVTNELPELARRTTELPAAVDFNGAAYMRQEQKGLLLGTYEHDCRHWAVRETPSDFGVELLPSDLERIAAPLSQVLERMPAIARAGVKRVVNGAMVFSPDSNPLIGPLPNQPTAFVATAVMAGFSQAGGVGLALARWIVDGEPGMDVFGMDVARFGNHATRGYVLARSREIYQRRFILSCPNEELEAGRPLRTSPLHARWSAAGAVFGTVAGWEVPMWFAESPDAARERPSFRRTPAFGQVDRECAAVRQGVGLWDTSCYCKIEIAGPGAAAWLDTIVANRVPAVGRMALCPMLTPQGRILGDITVAALAADRLLIFGSPAAEQVYLRWLMGHVGRSGLQVTSRTSAYSGLSLTGPRAREVLSLATDADVSNVSMPLYAVRHLTVGLAPVLALRVSFTGELGYELYTDPEFQLHVHDALMQAGRPAGLRPFGARALNALRLEKGYGGWGREYTQDYTPAEAGLQRFVCLDKDVFVGHEAVRAARDPAPRLRLRLLAIDSADPDPVGGEPVLIDGRAVARLTSAGFGHTLGYALGFAYLPGEFPVPSVGVEVELLGARVSARFLPEPPYDAAGLRLRV